MSCEGRSHDILCFDHEMEYDIRTRIACRRDLISFTDDVHSPTRILFSVGTSSALDVDGLIGHRCIVLCIIHLHLPTLTHTRESYDASRAHPAHQEASSYSF